MMTNKYQSLQITYWPNGVTHRGGPEVPSLLFVATERFGLTDLRRVRAEYVWLEYEKQDRATFVASITFIQNFLWGQINQLKAGYLN